MARGSNYKIAQLPNYKIFLERVHGKHDKTQQRRTEEIQTHGAQETQGGQAAEAPRLSPRLEEAQGQETGSRPGEAVSVTAHSCGADVLSAPSRTRAGSVLTTES